ncbi:DUF4166 domain-containing protein [Roseobacter sp.]|uniref:DUF4166 domain-containing protein n=1 Tax=Roseobacter sp. TaxID=1907202 RepID=UPI00261FF462|nr:DUF4166 domain-containing protein [Roseobacter sp.]MDW3183479.1 DUF4166 domain-containing protein [Roseobacter sp.]
MQMTSRFDPHNPQKDTRFSTLLGPEMWHQLPPAIQQRFGKRVRGGASVAYQGVVTDMQMNWAGWLLSQAARLVGGPLPYDMSCVGQPAIVVVTEDIAGDGQFWIRQYGRQSGFPQMVHSSKRFAGPTGLEEYIGYGIGMALRTEALDDALFFKSDHYFLSFRGLRMRLPRWMSPGALTIGHHDLGGGRFRFSLRLTNRLFGMLIGQDAVFQDAGGSS